MAKTPDNRIKIWLSDELSIVVSGTNFDLRQTHMGDMLVIYTKGVPEDDGQFLLANIKGWCRMDNLLDEKRESLRNNLRDQAR